jgi:H+/Cl- antiporter ClcA
MTPAAKTVCYFGFYLYCVALTLIFFPNVLLRLLGIPETSEVWIRIVGLLAGIIGYYYHRSGASGNRFFFRLTVQARILVFVVFLALALLRMASPMLIGFGVVDLLGAIWTWQALKQSGGSEH